MITVFYDACFALSLVLAIVYACLWHRHYGNSNKCGVKSHVS